MSINAMTNAAVARRPDFHPAQRVPEGYQEIARAAGLMPATAGEGDAAAQLPSPSGVETALQTLTTYIPTEVLTLYVAVIAALASGKGHAGPVNGSWPAFWFFLGVTPAAAWIAFATKIRAVDASKPLPLRPRSWPLWEMIAGTIAYAAWAFALPNAPFAGEGWYSPALAGVIVLVTSAILGLVAPLMQRPLPTQ